MSGTNNDAALRMLLERPVEFARLLGFDKKDSLRIGTGMMTRGEVALITAQKGLSVGLLTADFFTPVILLILVSSVITPILLKKLYKGPAPETAVSAAAK